MTIKVDSKVLDNRYEQKVGEIALFSVTTVIPNLP